jgi:hypothetical protein
MLKAAGKPALYIGDIPIAPLGARSMPRAHGRCL